MVIKLCLQLWIKIAGDHGEGSFSLCLQLWIKIGGDHDEGSLKLCLQLVNVNHPNSKHNTL